MLMVAHIHGIVPNNRKGNAKKFATYGNQCFYLGHTSAQHLLIFCMQDSVALHRVYSCKEQNLSEIRATPFRDTPLAFFPTGTNFIKIKACQFRYLGDRAKLSEVTHFTDQSRGCHLSYSLDGQNAVAVRDLFKIMFHLFFQAIYKAVLVSHVRNKMPDLLQDTLPAFADTYRLLCGFKNLPCTLLPQFPSARLSQDRAQTLDAYSNDTLRSGTIFYQVQDALRLHWPREFRKNNEKQMLQLITHRCSTLYSSLSGLAESAQLRCRPFRNNQCQSMSKRNNVSYHLWVLFVRLVGR